MTINLTKSNLSQLEQFIKLLKPISLGVAGLAIASLAIYPLISYKYVEKENEMEERVGKETTTLAPASYTIIIGESKDEVTIKFHNQNSELHLKNINTKEYNCLLNGGGVNCVLAEAYQPQAKVVEIETKPTPQTKAKSQLLKIPDIEISNKMMENIVVFLCVILALIVINKFRK